MVALIGADGSVNELEWAEPGLLWSERQYIAGSDLNPTVGAGVREAVTAAGWVRVGLCYAKFPASVSATLAVNANTTTPRKDYRVAEFNWQATATALGTLANSVEIKTVQGASGGNSPALVQTMGVHWQAPLGLYSVPSAGAVTVQDVRPRQRVLKVLQNIPAVVTQGFTSPGRQVAYRVIPDPGWPYVLEFLGVQAFVALTGNGHGNILVLVDGVQVTSGVAGKSNESPAVIRPEWTTTRTGPATVEWVAAPANISGESLTTSPNHSGFTTIVHPA